MHIVFLNDEFPAEGGSSVAQLVRVLAEEYEKRHLRVSIVTTHRREHATDIQTREDGRVISIPVSYRSSLRHYFSLYNPRVSPQLDRILENLQPDVLHAHNIHQYLTYDALRIARKHTQNIVLTCHDVMSIGYGRLATKRYLESEGGDVRLSVQDHIRTAGLQYNPLRNTLIRHAVQTNATHITAVSHALQNALEANNMQHTVVVYNGSKPELWRADGGTIEACRTTYALEGKKVVLFAGRIRKDKGVVQLLQALEIVRKAVPNVLLVAVGEADRWEGLVREANVPPDLQKNYLCIGWASQNTLAAAYGACDIVATPSLCLDTFNLVNLEAMANAKPVVGTIFGGTPEVVVDSITGFVRNPLHVEEFASAMLALLQNENMAKKMGNAGYDRFIEKFTAGHMADTYLKLYET